MRDPNFVTELATRPQSAVHPARKAMIDSQLRTSGINAPFVLDRMAAVAREDFVPETSRAVAYIDRAIALGDGKWLAAPLVQGAMLQEAAPTPADKALLVDGGSGYLAELLRPLVATLDVISAEEVIKSGRKGPYDLIVVDGAAEMLPDALAKRLADDGRIVTGTVSQGITRLAVGRRVGKTLALMPVEDMGIPRLAQFDAPKGWSF